MKKRVVSAFLMILIFALCIIISSKIFAILMLICGNLFVIYQYQYLF